MRKLLPLLLAVLVLLSGVPAAFAAGTEIETLKINPYGGAEDSIDTVSWFSSSGTYYCFLPADTDPDSAVVYFTAPGAVTLDGAPIISGGPAAGFSTGTHTLGCGEKTYSVTVMQSSGLPAIFIETESGSMRSILADKSHREAAVIRVYENGVLTTEGNLSYIKGRGNSTWTRFPKKPFNISFEEKTALLGMPQAKKWSLLANYADDTGIKTPAALALGRQLGIAYTGECRNVDLYLNGSYYGNYSVCESVEVGMDRVEITDLEKENKAANPGVELASLPRGGTGTGGTAERSTVRDSMKWVELPRDPEDITGGYLLELDFSSRYDEEASGFVTKNGQWVVIKSPEYASEAEVRYIAGLYGEAEEALYSETGYNRLGHHYSEYFDVEALLRVYLFTEVSKDLDAAISSFYFCKDAGSDLLMAAPVWDFDRAFYTRETRCASDLSDPDGWHANSFSYGRSNGSVFNTETVLTAFFRHEEIRSAASELWKSSVFGSDAPDVDALFVSLYRENAASAAMDLTRWKERSPDAARARAEQSFDAVSAFVHDRIAVLDGAFSDVPAMLYYDANGGTGHVYNRQIVSPGKSVTVMEPRVRDAFITPPGGATFRSWNTRADGAGTKYLPGQEITLNAPTTVLYAVWDSGHGGSLPVSLSRDLGRRILEAASQIMRAFPPAAGNRRAAASVLP